MSDKTRSQLVSATVEAGGRLRICNAMNPLLWLSGLIAVPCIVALSLGKEPSLSLSVCLFLTVVVALFSYLYLLTRDPERLHSGEFLVRGRARSSP